MHKSDAVSSELCLKLTCPMITFGSDTSCNFFLVNPTVETHTLELFSSFAKLKCKGLEDKIILPKEKFHIGNKVFSFEDYQEMVFIQSQKFLLFFDQS